MKDWPSPTNIKQLQQFLGFANYCNRFIGSFDYMVLHISKLLQQQQLWIYGTEQWQAFKRLKRLFCSAPVVALPNFSKPFDLYIDASNLAEVSALM